MPNDNSIGITSGKYSTLIVSPAPLETRRSQEIVQSMQKSNEDIEEELPPESCLIMYDLNKDRGHIGMKVDDANLNAIGQMRIGDLNRALQEVHLHEQEVRK